MHKRGYRENSVMHKAALKETIAAGMYVCLLLLYMILFRLLIILIIHIEFCYLAGIILALRDCAIRCVAAARF